MKKLIARFVFWLAGWKLVVKDEQHEAIKRSVMVAAPHTSNWDFLYALMAFWLMEIPLRYFIKDYYTRSPIGFIFKWSGALGVSKQKRVIWCNTPQIY